MIATTKKSVMEGIDVDNTFKPSPDLPLQLQAAASLIDGPSLDIDPLLYPNQAKLHKISHLTIILYNTIKQCRSV